MSELQHGNKNELACASAALDEAAARSLGCIAVTGHEPGEAKASAAAEEQHRDTSADEGDGLADPEDGAIVGGKADYVVVVANGKQYRILRSRYEEIISGIAPTIARRLNRRRWEDEAADASSRRSASGRHVDLIPAGQRNGA